MFGWLLKLFGQSTLNNNPEDFDIGIKKLFTSQNGEYSCEIKDYYRGKNDTALFYKNNALLWEKSFQLLWDVCILNSGYCFIHDAGSREERISHYYIVGITGDILFRHTLNSNGMEIGSANNERFLWATTANNRAYPNDSLILMVIDCKNLKVISKLPFGNSRPIDNIEIIDKKVLITSDMIIYEYLKDGTQINVDKTIKDRYTHFLANEQWQEIILINPPITQLKNETMAIIINALEKALPKYYGTPENKALAYRRLGEAYEKIENLQQARNAYQSALEINDKVGCKRKLAKLEKQQNPPQ